MQPPVLFFKEFHKQDPLISVQMCTHLEKDSHVYLKFILGFFLKFSVV